MRYVDAGEFARRLDLPAAIEAVRASLRRGDKASATCPPRSLIWREASLGVFGTMPGYFPLQDLFIVKVAAFVPNATAAGRPAVNAVVLAFDGRHGEPLAVIDGAALTRLKCAAVGAYVTDRCAIDGPVGLAIIGCGVQAHEQLRAVRAVRPLRELRIHSRTRACAEAWARELGAELPSHVSITVANDVASACDGADVVATATTSCQPLCGDGEVALPEHVHVNCMGAHTERSRELPLSLLRRSILVVEDRDTAVREAGEVHANALELGELEACDAVLRGQRTVFSSTGHVSVDAYVTAALLTRLELPGRQQANF